MEVRNLTKEEALEAIKKLEDYIQKKEEITEKDVYPGARFIILGSIRTVAKVGNNLYCTLKEDNCYGIAATTRRSLAEYMLHSNYKKV